MAKPFEPAEDVGSAARVALGTLVTPGERLPDAPPPPAMALAVTNDWLWAAAPPAVADASDAAVADTSDAPVGDAAPPAATALADGAAALADGAAPLADGTAADGVGAAGDGVTELVFDTDGVIVADMEADADVDTLAVGLVLWLGVKEDVIDVEGDTVTVAGTDRVGLVDAERLAERVAETLVDCEGEIDSDGVFDRVGVNVGVVDGDGSADGEYDGLTDREKDADGDNDMDALDDGLVLGEGEGLGSSGSEYARSTDGDEQSL